MAVKVGVFESDSSPIENENIMARWIQDMYGGNLPEISPILMQKDESVPEAAARYGVEIVVLPNRDFCPPEALAIDDERMYIVIRDGKVIEVAPKEFTATRWFPKDEDTTRKFASM